MIFSWFNFNCCSPGLFEARLFVHRNKPPVRMLGVAAGALGGLSIRFVSDFERPAFRRGNEDSGDGNVRVVDT
jgi:hypothetical protein